MYESTQMYISLQLSARLLAQKRPSTCQETASRHWGSVALPRAKHPDSLPWTSLMPRK